MRSDRLFELIQLFRRAKRPVTAQRLAEQLEVTARTIYRDVASLQAMGVPIMGEAGVGYVMQKGFDLPPVMFDVVEVEAITVGLALLSRTGDRSLIKAARRVAGKLADVVPRQLAGDFTSPAFHVSDYGAPETDLAPFREALRQGRKLQITYGDGKGDVTQRTVLPVALFYYVEVVLLAAWCDLRNDFRHFRVDRIAGWRILDGDYGKEASARRQQWLASGVLHRPDASE
ncbi:MAG: YafY family transcriptional regulator [Proteobacteria bacterium]|nr:YafY family transcriptional regulator [Pseudomonadota bacterium]